MSWQSVLWQRDLGFGSLEDPGRAIRREMEDIRRVHRLGYSVWHRITAPGANLDVDVFYDSRLLNRYGRYRDTNDPANQAVHAETGRLVGAREAILRESELWPIYEELRRMLFQGHRLDADTDELRMWESVPIVMADGVLDFNLLEISDMRTLRRFYVAERAGLRNYENVMWNRLNQLQAPDYIEQYGTREAAIAGVIANPPDTLLDTEFDNYIETDRMERTALLNVRAFQWMVILADRIFHRRKYDRLKRMLDGFGGGDSVNWMHYLYRDE